jgi:hypothetical protein
MFSFSFTMREQIARFRGMGSGRRTSTTRQPVQAATRWHVLTPAPLAHLEICGRSSYSSVRGPREKSCEGMKAKRRTPCRRNEEPSIACEPGSYSGGSASLTRRNPLLNLSARFLTENPACRRGLPPTFAVFAAETEI